MKRNIRHKDEKDFLSSFERDEWKSAVSASTIKRYRSYAKAALRKDKRINIRLSEADLHLLQRRALEDGIPYQTLAASLIHKYVTGRLLEKKRAA